jgi:uncharacterized protein (TIGR02001 family)
VIDSRRLLAALVGLVAPDVFGADLRLGAAIASDYVFRGVVQTDQGIAYQAVAEIESAHGFYGGVWTSRVDYAFDERNAEVDWFAGWLIRISDAFALDAGIVRYTYDADFAGEETDWTELQLATHVHDRWSFLVAAARGWLATDERSYVAEATYRHPLPALVVLDATWGQQFADAVIDQRYGYGELGLSRAFGPIDVRLAVADTFGADLPHPLDDTRYTVSVEWAILR